jgi:hypothetical protein
MPIRLMVPTISPIHSACEVVNGSVAIRVMHGLSR